MNKQFLAKFVMLAVALGGVSAASAANIKVTITNNSPTGGLYLTPIWVGFHNGSFDIYNGGLASTTELERLAEDGNTGPISATFNSNGTLVPTGTAQTGARVDGTLGGAPVGPGGTVTQTFQLAHNDDNRYFSYASMVLPSNDYYVANGNPLAFDIASLINGPVGSTISFNIGLPGGVIDAGTEVNDFQFSAGNGLFAGLPAGQGGPNQGTDENGVNVDVANPFSNFLNVPPGFDLSNFNFNDPSLYPNGIATVTLTTDVPEPGSIMLLGSALLAGLAFSRRRRK